jgi:hypothetical protein
MESYQRARILGLVSSHYGVYALYMGNDLKLHQSKDLLGVDTNTSVPLTDCYIYVDSTGNVSLISED